MTDPLPVPDDLRHALLDIEDRIARLQDLLQLIAMAGEGLEPPHAAAIARGIQLAQTEAGEIREDVEKVMSGAKVKVCRIGKHVT